MILSLPLHPPDFPSLIHKDSSQCRIICKCARGCCRQEPLPLHPTIHLLCTFQFSHISLVIYNLFQVSFSEGRRRRRLLLHWPSVGGASTLLTCYIASVLFTEPPRDSLTRYLKPCDVLFPRVYCVRCFFLICDLHTDDMQLRRARRCWASFLV